MKCMDALVTAQPDAFKVLGAAAGEEVADLLRRTMELAKVDEEGRSFEHLIAMSGSLRDKLLGNATHVAAA